MYAAKLGRRTLILGGGGLLLGGAADLAVPRRSYASVVPPRVYTRAEWSARPPSSPITVLATRPDHIVVHHTASGNTTDYSLLQAGRLSHWIQDLHMDTNGWADAGQQLTISRGGYVLEGRDQSLSAINNGKLAVGAQTANQNNHTIGIENEGLYTAQDTTTMLFDSLVQTCAWLCVAYGLDPYQAIVGHRDYVTTTQCPGDVLYARLPELRNRTAALLGA
ncbi:peptidoglycan recognition protein family protein [Catellatospora tritici]|uniref:peptidoglycan recognition protein family protein n=1 Tax=Catellatospora tritici TaxID=2851566 RepID=UPI001C2D0216|nr:peptidoglycan recognition family protein [Catellatospora tritici]MBV1851344.1 peptidoglycan recognition protein family protein [Catellatospora tritici]